MKMRSLAFVAGLMTLGGMFPLAAQTVQPGCPSPGSISCFAPAAYSYTHIATTTTTLIKTGSGILHTICVNTVGVGATITADDALTATTPTIAILSGATLGCYRYDIVFSTGLTIVTGTAAADITVAWR